MSACCHVADRLGPLNFPDWDIPARKDLHALEDNAASHRSGGWAGLNPDAPDLILRTTSDMSGMQQPQLSAKGGPLNPLAPEFNVRVAAGLDKEFR